jgi:hypothetical protein
VQFRLIGTRISDIGKKKFEKQFSSYESTLGHPPYNNRAGL